MVADLQPNPKRVLFLCTYNSARSQMAEGLLRHLGGDRFEVASAGTQATFVRPLAVQAMAEIGIDISSHESKALDSLHDRPFDYVVTLCDEAAAACPVFPGDGQRLHWPFPDPSAVGDSPEAQLAAYRRVRDGIRARIERELLST
jgi:arsenate reductase